MDKEIMRGRLDRITNEHLAMAQQWAQDKFQRFPNLTEITIDAGVAFMLQFSVALTFTRPAVTSEVFELLALAKFSEHLQGG